MLSWRSLSFYSCSTMFYKFSEKKLFDCICRFLVLAGFILASNAIRAQGDLLIYPKRIVFDGNKRSQNLNLVNSGDDSAQYIISVIQIRMKEDGSFENISQPDSGQLFSDRNFRFFPRSVVLGPKESQTVKVQLIQFSTLPAGEYRSHLYFRAEKIQQPLGDTQTKSVTSSISIQIKPVYGLSIPVIIRSGESNTAIALSKVHFHLVKDSLPLLEMNIERSGNMSVYGDIRIDYISDQGTETQVALVRGVAVYTPNNHRKFALMLDRYKGINYHAGALHILFTDSSGNVEKLAQEQLFLK
jgi:hypothetical protein